MQRRGFLKWLRERSFNLRKAANSRPRFLPGLFSVCRFALRFKFPLTLLAALLISRRPDHGFQFHPIGIGEINGIVFAPVILARRIDDIGAVAFEKSAKRVDILAARHFEGIVMKADIAFTIFAFPTFGIGAGDPEQGLVVAPSR